MESQLRLKALLYQNYPKIKEVAYNIKVAEQSFQKFSKDDNIDFVILAEMAFTGNNFKDKEDIRDCCEVAGQGDQFKFMSQLAIKLDSYVYGGYPEYVAPNEQDGNEHFYNSAYLIDRQGNLLLNYRKKHLYVIDKLWQCEEGKEFAAIDLKTREGQIFRAGVGICMDINPYEFIDPSLCELANFQKKQNIDVLLHITNWDDDKNKSNADDDPDIFVNYFFKRLTPLINSSTENKYHKNWAYLHCNRVGIEYTYSANFDLRYVGCSCVYQFNPQQQQGQLNQKAETILEANILLNQNQSVQQ